MKKIVSILLTLCMIAALALTVTPAVSAEGGMTATVIAPAKVAIGDVFTVGVQIDNNAAFNAFRLILNFDPDCYEVVERFAATDVLSTTATENLIIGEDKENTMLIASYAYKDETVDDGVILTATLRVKETADRTMDQGISFRAGRDDKNVLWNYIQTNSTYKDVTFVDAATVVDGARATGTTDEVSVVKKGKKYNLTYAGYDKVVYLPDIATATDFAMDTIPYTLIDDGVVTEYPEYLFYGVFDEVTVPVNFYIYGMDAVFGDQCIGYDSNDDIDTNVTVHCYPGSTAETYCVDNGVNYVYIEEFNAYGTQKRTDGNGYRFVARMRYADTYTSAKIVIETAGKAPLTKDITTVYQSLSGTTASGATYEAVKTAAGYYLTAIAINGCPSGTSFTFKTYVTDAYGTDILVDTQDYTYTA